MGELRELADLRHDAEGLARDLAGLLWRRAAGLPPGATLPQIAKEHRLATSHDGLAQACEALGNAVEDEQSPGRIARLSALRECAARARALGLEPGAAQELLDLQTRPSVRPPGDAGLHGAIPLVQVERELPFELHRDKRGELEASLADAVNEQGPVRSAVWDAALAALEECGQGEPAQASAELQARGWAAREGTLAVDLAAAEAERFLHLTDSIAQDLGGWLLERRTSARPFPGGAERHDVLHLVHAPACATAFPRGEHLRTLRRWAEMLRLDPTANRTIKLDDEERPLKFAGAHAVATDPPDEVRVSFFPVLGPHALSQLLSSLGQSLLLVGAPGDAPPEDLWLGDEGVRIACGDLLGGLARDPIFIHRVAKADLHRDDERAVAYAAVVEARLAAAATISSIEALKAGGITARVETAHRDLFARAVSAELPGALARREIDPWLGPWAKLRGLCLAARLRAFFRDRHDEDWWRNPRALPLLKALWARGGRPTVREIWGELGEDGPGVDALAGYLLELCA